jgi:hypothetical protein
VGVGFEEFGSSVSIDGDVIAIGAPGTGLESGVAWVFRKSSVWAEIDSLGEDSGVEGDRFGSSVAVAGGVVLVGSFGDDVGSNADQGSAYTFYDFGDAWVGGERVTASVGAANDHFAVVSFTGTIAVSGSPYDDVGSNANQGSAYAYTLPPTDSDGDGLSDPHEGIIGSGSFDIDSDDDGLNDMDELNLHGTDPLDADSDDDGLTDFAEIATHATDPLDPDTDGDSFTDGEEVVAGTDPQNPFNHPAFPVPSLSAPGLMLLGALLSAVAMVAGRRRR